MNTDPFDTDPAWNIRTAVYRHFVETGEAPDIPALAGQTGMAAADIRDGLRAMADRRQLVLAPASVDQIWMAHPFSAVPTEFPVDTAERRYWANCAWDAFGIAAVLDEDCHITMRCAETGVTVDFRVRGGQAVAAEGLVHFAVPARDFWKNVGFT